VSCANGVLSRHTALFAEEVRLQQPGKGSHASAVEPHANEDRAAVLASVGVVDAREEAEEVRELVSMHMLVS
jgi:hypothetical protein